MGRETAVRACPIKHKCGRFVGGKEYRATTGFWTYVPYPPCSHTCEHFIALDNGVTPENDV